MNNKEIWIFTNKGHVRWSAVYFVHQATDGGYLLYWNGEQSPGVPLNQEEGTRVYELLLEGRYGAGLERNQKYGY